MIPSQPKGQQPKSAVPKPATNGTATRGAKTARGGRGGRRGRNAGRPKPKTADELDAEMTDYFDGNAANGTAATTDASATGGAAQPAVNGGEEMDEISVCDIENLAGTMLISYYSKLADTNTEELYNPEGQRWRQIAKGIERASNSTRQEGKGVS